MFLYSLFFSSMALAQDCDAGQLVATVKESVGDQTATAFIDLNKCDPKQATKLASTVVPKLYAGDLGYQAMAIALSMGAEKEVVDWLNTQLAGERSEALRYLGTVCKETKEVQDFFITQAEKMGEEFWVQRWYRPLDQCSTPEVLALLKGVLDKGIKKRSVYFGVLTTFSRAAGKDAIPVLENQLSKITDVEVQTRIIEAYADAAQVGSKDGLKKDIAALVVVYWLMGILG